MGFAAWKRGEHRWPVIVSVRPEGKNGLTFRVSFSPKLYIGLGWRAGDLMDLSFGTGQDEGWVRITPHGVRKLQRVPRSDRLMITAKANSDWTQCQALEVQEFKPDPIGRRLTLRLPWATQSIARVA